MQITNQGRALQAKAQAGTALVFTRFRIGSGSLSGQQIADLTNLITPQKWLTLNKSVAAASGTHTLGAPLSNADITTGFYFREWGVFAQDPDAGEILYSYGNVGTGAEYISAGGGSDIVEKQLDAIAIIGNASNVSALIDESLVFPSLADFEDHVVDGVKHITSAERTAWNAKETTSGAQAKATAAQTAAISTAATDATNKSNAVQTNLNTHDNNTVKHITAAERTNWNSKAPTTEVTTGAAGLMSSTDKVKLDGIAAGAQVNPGVATSTMNGLMSSTDKSKLDGVATGANNYVHPSNHPASIITQDANNRFVTDAEKAAWNAKETTSGAQAKVDTHAADAVKHITAAERTSWNAKQVALGYVPENVANKNISGGYAGLDNGAKLPTSLLPDSILGQVEYIGTWNANTNTPTLPTATSAKGDYYVVSVAGTYASLSFEVGDWVISNGVTWQKVDNTDAVPTVFGRTGNVIAAPNDYTWAQINKAVSSIADITTRNLSDLTQNATNRTVTDTEKTTWNAKETTTGSQAKVDTHAADTVKHITADERAVWNAKANIDSPALTGVPTAPTASAGTNTTQLATTAFVATAIAGKANSASPSLTGTPTAPTAADTVNNTQLATTAYVTNRTGALSGLQTSAKGNLVAAINEVFQAGSSFKSDIASAITSSGVPTDVSATKEVMASNISLLMPRAGSKWSSDPIGNGEIGGVAYGNGVYVCIENNSNSPIRWSVDGINWTVATVPSTSPALSTYSWSFIDFCNGVFVAYTSSNRYLRSVDGKSWTSVTVTAPTSNNINAVTKNATTFIAFEMTGGGYRTSTNGSTWTSRTHALMTDDYIVGAAWGNDVFVVIGSDGSVMTSTNGTTGWTLRRAKGSTQGGLLSICFGAGEFVILGYQYILKSTDGINWTSYAKAAPIMPLTNDKIAYGFGVYIATRYGNPMIHVSTDGVNWISSKVDASNLRPGTSVHNQLTYAKGLFLIATSRGMLVSNLEISNILKFE